MVHAEIRIGSSVVMLGDDVDPSVPGRAPSSVGGATTVLLATYWADVDTAWQRAMSAGAEEIYPLADQFYGDRGGRLRDPFGHQWTLSQRIEELTADELRRRGQELFGGAS